MPSRSLKALPAILAASLIIIGLLAPSAIYCAQDVPTIYPRTSTEAPVKAEAVELDDEPTLDGRDLEWEGVPEAVVPLWPTVERDPDNQLGPVDLHLKAGLFGDVLYLRFQWPDPLPNATHLSWVWDFTRNSYRPGSDLEDRLAVRFGWSEGFSACPLAGSPHRADLWLWRAARSNPVGYAVDAVQVVSDSPISGGHPWRLPDGRVRWLAFKLDGGEEFTYTKTYSGYRGDIVPKFIVKKAEKLSGSRMDVEAKGIWLDGFWTLELARSLDTTSPDDVLFRRGEVVELSISAANQGAGAHESVSPLIKLILPPEDQKQTAQR